MLKFNVKLDQQKTRRFLIALSIALFLSIGSNNAFGNHPVLVEGNCNNPPAGSGVPMGSPAGTCGDYDGDGRIGTAEDTDGDRVFGTITAALANATGANQNGMVTIVTSGTFAEVVSITGANGNVTLQAAPGVHANIDAVLQGDPGSTGRQNAPGIVVNSPANRYIVIRNIFSRNWRSGIRISGDSRVAIESCIFENNVDYGIEVNDNARVTIAKSEVHGTGFRVGGGLNFPVTSIPSPGRGIEFSDNSSGTVFFTTVSGSFGAGIANFTRNPSSNPFQNNNFGNNNNVCVSLVNVFDNSPNFINVNRRDNCGNTGNF